MNLSIKELKELIKVANRLDNIGLYKEADEIDFFLTKFAVDSAPQANLRYGSRGDGVKTLQQQLNKLMNAGLVEDGIFGTNTKAAVVNFQKNNNLQVDGIVGPQTYAALNAAAPITQLSPDGGAGTGTEIGAGTEEVQPTTVRDVRQDYRTQIQDVKDSRYNATTQEEWDQYNADIQRLRNERADAVYQTRHENRATVLGDRAAVAESRGNTQRAENLRERQIKHEQKASS